MPNEKPPTIHRSVHAFLRLRFGANKSAATVAAFWAGLQQFARYLVEVNFLVTTPADTACADVTEFRSYLGTQGKSGTTRALKPATRRVCVSSLNVHGLLRNDPTPGIQMPMKERGGYTARRA